MRTKIREYTKQCEGKDRYGDQVSADRAAANIRKRRKVDLQVYHCWHCGFFHIGGGMR